MVAGGGHWNPYYVTQRLISLLSENWIRFDGWCAASNIDPMELEINRLISLTIHWATEGVEDQKQYDSWIRRLWIPPKGTAPSEDSPWSAAAEKSAFSSLKAQVQPEA